MSEDAFGVPFNGVFRKLTLAIAFGLVYWWELGLVRSDGWGVSMVTTHPGYPCDRNVGSKYFFIFFSFCS